MKRLRKDIIIHSNDEFDLPFKFTNPISIFTSQKPQQLPEEEEEEKEEEDLQKLVGTAAANEALLKLPLDIFLDILSRLPVKRLAVCKCVCKTWRTIVHHSRFTIMHHNKAIQSSQSHNCFSSNIGLVLTFHYIYSHYDIMNQSPPPPDLINFLQHETDDSFDDAVLVNHPFSFRDWRFLSSCNGLLCFIPNDFLDYYFYIWNPVTGEYMILPDAPTGTGNYGFAHGFGFDKVANEYKIIKLCLKQVCVPNEKPTYKMMGAVFTLGSHEWRMLSDVPYKTHNPASGAVFANGSLHWIGEDDNWVVSSSNFIVAFDVGSEEFRIVPPPPSLIPRCTGAIFKISPHYCHQILGNLGGCLSIANHISHNLCEIWVMKDYGVEGSWTKEYAISLEEVDYRRLQLVRPISLMKNGNILMVHDEKSLVCYDPRTKSRSEVGRIDGRYRCKAIAHVGSLLSLRNIIQQTNGEHRVKTARWYGDLRLIQR